MASTAQDPHAPLRGGEKAKDDDLDEVEFSPFYGIEKGAVLQEARIFHGPNLDARKCQQVITKLLYLLNQGETFSKKEASEVFFAATKLFQNKDMNLRRMVYLCLKDICPGADEVIIVTSSLMKDMNAREELYRSNAIRVLRTIIDTQLLQQIERYFTQSVVDKSAVVASSALVAGLHLYRGSPEIVKRWSNEVNSTINSKHTLVHYHAIALALATKSGDRLAISKLVQQLAATGVRGPHANCLLIKYIAVVIKDTTPPPDGSSRPFYDFLMSSLRHKSEVVMFQAARTIAQLNQVSMRELAPAITVLQLFLSSSKPVLRFAAVRTLNMVSMSHPIAVANCNMELEQLMTDSNRSVATYAITTLLKTGSESSVDRLLKQIGAFMSDIADDFKVVVVDAIHALCLKYPAKHRVLMSFLSHTLREEGGFEFKRAIVQAILALIKQIDAAKEAGLLHLAEFVEDCEFTYLATQVLHAIGQEGPATSEPSKLIRYVYNRIILENATVRAAAVSTLAQFALRCPSLRARLLVVLRRALTDNDDEVRDRAALFVTQIEALPPAEDAAGGDESAHAAAGPRLTVPLPNLEKELHEYLDGGLDADFDVDAVSREVDEPIAPPKKGKKGPEAPAAAKPPPLTEAEELGKEVEQMPQFAALGRRFKSCAAEALTEEDTEYIVLCVKHVFEAHMVLQFNCTNTITSQVLENVTVEVDMAELDDAELCEDMTVPLKRMPHSGSGSTFLVLERSPDALPAGPAVAVLKFTTKEVDPATGDVEDEGYDDEYQLEDLQIAAADYIRPVPTANFKAAWDALDESTEVSHGYALGATAGGIVGTTEAMIAHLGMHVCEGTDVVAPNARSHMLMVAGELCGAGSALVRLSFGLDADGGVMMKVSTRGGSPEISEILHAIVQDA